MRMPLGYTQTKGINSVNFKSEVPIPTDTNTENKYKCALKLPAQYKKPPILSTLAKSEESKTIEGDAATYILL